MFCPLSAFRVEKIGKRRAAVWFPGMWALGETEERPAGRSLAVDIKDDSSLQWDLPEDAMNLDLK